MKCHYVVHNSIWHHTQENCNYYSHRCGNCKPHRIICSIHKQSLVENIYRVTILSPNYWLQLPVALFITLTQPTQATTHRQNRSRK